MALCLIVDDHPTMAEALGFLLTNAGHTASFCTSLAEAREQLDHLQPDLLVCDWNLDPGSGLDLLEEAPALSPETRTIIYTAFPSFGLILRAGQLGARAVCTKCAQWSELRTTVRQVLDGAGWVLDPICAEIARREHLTDQELSILADMALGVRPEASAMQDGKSRSEAYRVRAKLTLTLNLDSPVDVVDAARRTGALPPSIAQRLLR
jgi:DNA-binding NarL/FixJ family response regulator